MEDYVFHLTGKQAMLFTDSVAFLQQDLAALVDSMNQQFNKQNALKEAARQAVAQKEEIQAEPKEPNPAGNGQVKIEKTMK